ncbi:hypothetical protein J8I87_42170 [Paraburkholderia sp. LEh10]|uniref:hypothetical protein n=1 Tax=Paraburkholderia sp. LEh10 TaxID=2821353 RepID=UPI001AE11206|nr:hypothetical protein [Paraburkholderia sp. LEh10]MBP0596104.1 hypothetical protein [Paraburkholderia sp. LEh10]
MLFRNTGIFVGAGINQACDPRARSRVCYSSRRGSRKSTSRLSTVAAATRVKGLRPIRVTYVRRCPGDEERLHHFAWVGNALSNVSAGPGRLMVVKAAEHDDWLGHVGETRWRGAISFLLTQPY